MNGVLTRLVRYGLVGVAVNAGGYLLYLLVTWLGVGPKMAMTFLYGAGATMGYFGNRRFAFGYDGSYPRSIARYGLAHLSGYGLNFVLLYVFVDRLGYSHHVVQAIAVLMVAAFLFVAFRLFVFRVSGGELCDGKA